MQCVGQGYVLSHASRVLCSAMLTRGSFYQPFGNTSKVDECAIVCCVPVGQCVYRMVGSLGGHV